MVLKNYLRQIGSCLRACGIKPAGSLYCAEAGHLPCLRLIGRIVYDMDKGKMLTKTIVIIKQIRGGLKMSDEKRREELNAKINEQPDNLSIEDLEKVAGGTKENYWCRKCGTAFSSHNSKCPKCGSTKTDHITQR